MLLITSRGRCRKSTPRKLSSAARRWRVTLSRTPIWRICTLRRARGHSCGKSANRLTGSATGGSAVGGSAAGGVCSRDWSASTSPCSGARSCASAVGLAALDLLRGAPASCAVRLLGGQESLSPPHCQGAPGWLGWLDWCFWFLCFLRSGSFPRTPHVNSSR